MGLPLSHINIMSTKLSLIIKYSDVKKNFLAQITEQYSRKIDHMTKNGYRIKSVVCPEIDEDIFYVWGKLQDRDNNWMDFDYMSNTRKFIQALHDFAEENNWNINCMSDGVIIFISISEEGKPSTVNEIMDALFKLKDPNTKNKDDN